MDITTTQVEGQNPITILRIYGKVNLTEPLVNAAEKAYAAGARRIVLDLTDVPYISSAGLKAVHEIYNLLRAGTEFENTGIGGPNPYLKLANPSELVADIIKMTAFDVHIEVHPNVSSAVDSF